MMGIDTCLSIRSLYRDCIKRPPCHMLPFHLGPLKGHIKLMTVSTVLPIVSYIMLELKLD